MPIIEQPSDIDHAPFKPVVARWFELRADGRLPTREAMLAAPDPLAGYRMENTFTYDPIDVQYDYVGEDIEKLYGGPMAGKNLKELYNDWFRKRAYEGYRMTADAKLPMYERRSFASIITKLGYFKMHLPLGGERMTHAFTYIMPMSPDIKTREDWERIVKRLSWF